ncbi:hypothetical protein JCM30237_00830 [Halolamina litorea]
MRIGSVVAVTMAGTREWSVTKSPKVAQLTGVESSGDAAYATGRRGVLLERAGPSQWTAVFTTGPVGEGRSVLDASTTDDGERVWFCGENGTLGYYEPATDSVETHFSPYDLDTTFRSVSAKGAAGEETVHVADDNGEIVRGEMDGPELTVRSVAIPGDGTALTEVVDNDREVFACDAAGTFYHTTVDQQAWKRRTLSDTPVRAVSFNDANVYEIAEDGTVFEEVSLFGEGSRNPRSIDSGVESPTEIDTDDRRTIAVVGDGGQLRVSENGGNFRHADIEAEATLYGAEVMDDGTIIAVGDDGTIVEGCPN